MQDRDRHVHPEKATLVLGGKLSVVSDKCLYEGIGPSSNDWQPILLYDGISSQQCMMHKIMYSEIHLGINDSEQMVRHAVAFLIAHLIGYYVKALVD